MFSRTHLWSWVGLSFTVRVRHTHVGVFGSFLLNWSECSWRNPSCLGGIAWSPGFWELSGGRRSQSYCCLLCWLSRQDLFSVWWFLLSCAWMPLACCFPSKILWSAQSGGVSGLGHRAGRRARRPTLLKLSTSPVTALPSPRDQRNPEPPTFASFPANVHNILGFFPLHCV